VVEAEGFDADQDLTVAGGRVREFGVGEDLGVAVVGNNDGAHRSSPRFLNEVLEWTFKYRAEKRAAGRRPAE
jgi:hypothetical protein